ncbi:MAG: taurine catabolism dioxygenase TauD [Gammaproteobacteria bacterium]|nr:MAG: taurine catabolism dioxygenase TauD [Gammaproteobacteria bacterium]
MLTSLQMHFSEVLKLILSKNTYSGPEAWYGSDMKNQQSSWLYELTAIEIEEIKQAVLLSKKTQPDIVKVTQQDFPLPTLEKNILAIHEQVLRGCGFTVIRNFPIESFNKEDAIRASWGLGCHLGDAVSQNALGHMIGHVKAIGNEIKTTQTRTYRTNDLQPFHTDSCDMVALFCLRPAPTGGLSSIVSAVTIHNEMMKIRQDLVEVLYQPFNIGRKGEIPEGKEKTYQMAIFHDYKGYLSIMHDRNFIDNALSFDDVPRLTPLQEEALDMLDSLAADENLRLDFKLEIGDIQLAHNHSILHARTKYQDHKDPTLKRHMLRLWLSQPDGRPLPPVFAERYSNIELGSKRGGIVVPGMTEKIPMEPE